MTSPIDPLGYQPITDEQSGGASIFFTAQWDKLRRYLDTLGSGAGSGTVTSVAISGNDGIDVDSGSPITSSGTIQLGISSATLLTHIGLSTAAADITQNASDIVTAQAAADAAQADATQALSDAADAQSTADAAMTHGQVMARVSMGV